MYHLFMARISSLFWLQGKQNIKVKRQIFKCGVAAKKKTKNKQKKKKKKKKK